jgi:ABC-type nickel/cobalt efflux system permease component RcnA
MPDLAHLLQQNAAHAWLYLPVAAFLGALHGLEPGHSKTMMAAFLIAVRGTIAQAVLLGLSAAFSHSLVIWILAFLALKFGQQWNVPGTEPYLQMISAALILGVAGWMAWRTWSELRAEAAHHHDHTSDGHPHAHGFSEYQDAHELSHAREIETRFSGRRVTTGQIAIFGLTGGLLPCPAALTIVLVCVQLKHFALGIAMVLAFSAGLAATLVIIGATVAWSLHRAQKRFQGLGTLARRLPFISSALLAMLGLFLGWQGWSHLPPR